MRFEHVLRRFAHKLMSLYSVNLYEVCNYYAKSIYNIYTFLIMVLVDVIDSECNISIYVVFKTNKWPSDKIDKEITDKVV